MMERHGIDAIVAIGGEGTLAGAKRLADAGLPVIGVPKTIDNDLRATDYTFGFDTAVSIATEAMDRIRTTGESHHRCMVAEVMGRHVGWIALHSGMAAGAHAILIPEVTVSMEQVAEWVKEVHDRGRSPLVVVAEGFIPEGFDDVMANKGTEKDGRPRLGGIGEYITHEIEAMTGIETRNTILGHIQRGGAPTGYDRARNPSGHGRSGYGCTEAVGQDGLRSGHRNQVRTPRRGIGWSEVRTSGTLGRGLRALRPLSRTPYDKTAEAGTHHECPPRRFLRF